MDIKNVRLLATKSRSQIIDEFKNLKPEPYVTGIKTAVILVSMFCVNNYFTGEITDKMALAFVIAGAFIALDILFSISNLDKKITLLFELEKMKSTEDSGNAVDEKK